MVAKTLVVFGAGSGLGSAVARRFGREGYRIALVARRREPLENLRTELAAVGVEADVFPADLADPVAVERVLSEVRSRFGTIDAIEYAPIGAAGFTPAAELGPDGLSGLLQLLVLTPVQIVQDVLPEMLERGDGAILVGHGVSAVTPMAGLSGVGPAMAATRNYLYSLHAEVADRGVYVGTIAVAAMVLGSAGHAALTSGEVTFDLPAGVGFPTVDPADLADLYWDMVVRRDRVEVVHPGVG